MVWKHLRNSACVKSFILRIAPAVETYAGGGRQLSYLKPSPIAASKWRKVFWYQKPMELAAGVLISETN
jgi:hypothetical protein